MLLGITKKLHFTDGILEAALTPNQAWRPLAWSVSLRVELTEGQSEGPHVKHIVTFHWDLVINAALLRGRLPA